MAMQEVPRSEWSAFLESFSRSHEGWLCRLDETAPYLPLVAIAAGAIRDDRCAVDIHLGEEPAHIVRDPARVVLETDERSADKALHIEAADGRTTTLRFRVAALPESVDGLAAHLP